MRTHIMHNENRQMTRYPLVPTTHLIDYRIYSAKSWKKELHSALGEAKEVQVKISVVTFVDLETHSQLGEASGQAS